MAVLIDDTRPAERSMNTSGFNDSLFLSGRNINGTRFNAPRDLGASATSRVNVERFYDRSPIGDDRLAAYQANRLHMMNRVDSNRNIPLGSPIYVAQASATSSVTTSLDHVVPRTPPVILPTTSSVSRPSLSSTFYDDQDEFISGQVVRIIDADTIDVQHGGETTRIRFAFIDAFERAQDPWGALATERLEQLIPIGTQVQVQVDSIGVRGRTVGQVYLGEQNINLQLVREGHAAVFRDYEIDPRARNAFERAEMQARAEGLNFWSDGSAIMPWLFREFQRRGLDIPDLEAHREYERRRLNLARRYGAATARVADATTFPTVVLGRGLSTDYEDMIAFARHTGARLELETPVMTLSVIRPEDSRDVETLYQAKRAALGYDLLEEDEIPEFIREMDSRKARYNVFEAINRWAYGSSWAQEILNFGAVERYRKVVFSEPSMGSGLIKNFARGIGSRLDSYLNEVFNRIQPRGTQSSQGHETVGVAEYQRNMEGLFVSGAQFLTSMYTATMMYYGIMRPVEQIIGNLGAFSSASLIRGTRQGGGFGFVAGLAKGFVEHMRQRSAENIFRQALGPMALDYLGFDLDIKTPMNSAIGGPRRTLRTYTRYADFETQNRKFLGPFQNMGLKVREAFGVQAGYFIDKNTGKTLNFRYGGENRTVEFAVRDVNRLNKSLFVGDQATRIQTARGVAEGVNNILTLIGLYSDTDTTFPDAGVRLYTNAGLGELSQRGILIKDGATRMQLIQQNIQDIMYKVSANPLRWAGLELGGWLGADISFGDLFGVEGVINRGISYAAGREMYSMGGKASTVVSGLTEMWWDMKYNTINRIQQAVAATPLGSALNMKSAGFFKSQRRAYLGIVSRSREIKLAQNIARNMGANSQDLKALTANIKSTQRAGDVYTSFKELNVFVPREKRFGTRASRLIATSVLTSWTISALFSNSDNFYQPFADSWNWGNADLLDGDGGLFNFTRGNLFNVGVFSRMAGDEGEPDSWHVNWANAAVYGAAAGYAIGRHVTNRTFRNMMRGNWQTKRMAMLSVPAVAGRALGRAAVGLAALSVAANRLGALNTWFQKGRYAKSLGLNREDIDTDGYANFRMARRLMEINAAGQENFGWLKTNMPIAALERAGVGNPFDADTNASVRPTVAFQSGNLLMTSVAGIYSFRGQTNITSGIQLPMHTLGFGMILPFKLNFTGQDFVNMFLNRGARSSRLVPVEQMEAARGDYSIYAAPYWSGALFQGRGVRMVYQPGTPMERLVMSYAMSTTLEAAGDLVSQGFKGVGAKVLNNTTSDIAQRVGHKLIGISTSIDDSLIFKGIKLKKKIEGLFLNITLNQLGRGVVNNATKLRNFIGYQSLRGVNSLSNKVFGAPVAPVVSVVDQSIAAAQQAQSAALNRQTNWRDRFKNVVGSALADPTTQLSFNTFASPARFGLGTTAKFVGLVVLSEAISQGVFGVEGVGAVVGAAAGAYGIKRGIAQYRATRQIVRQVTTQSPEALIRAARSGAATITARQASQINMAIQDRARDVASVNKRLMRFGTIALGTGLIAAALASAGESTRPSNRPTGFLDRLYRLELRNPWGGTDEEIIEARRRRMENNNFFMNLLPYMPRRFQVGRAIALFTGGNRSYYTRQLRVTETNVYGETFVDPSMPFQRSPDRPDGGPGFFDTFFGSIDAISGSAYGGQTMEPGFHAGVAGIAARDFDGGYQAASTYGQFQRPLSDISFALGVISGAAEAGFMSEYISSVRRVVENRNMTDEEKYLAITLGKSRALSKPRSFSKFMHSQSTRAVGGNRVISSTLAQRQQYLQWMRNATPLDLLTWSSRDRGAAGGMREMFQNATRQGEGKATVASIYSAVSSWLGGGTTVEEQYGFDPTINQLGEYDDDLQLLTNMGLYDRDTRLGTRGVLTGRDVNMGLVGKIFGVLGGGAAVYLTFKTLQYGLLQKLGVNQAAGVDMNIRGLREMRTSLLNEVVQGTTTTPGARHVGSIPRNIRLRLVKGSATAAAASATNSKVSLNKIIPDATVRAVTGTTDPKVIAEYRFAGSADITERSVYELSDTLNTTLQKFRAGIEAQISALDEVIGAIDTNAYNTSAKQILTARGAIKESLVKFRGLAISGGNVAGMSTSTGMENMKKVFGAGANFEDIVKTLTGSRGQLVGEALEGMSQAFTDADSRVLKSVSGFDSLSGDLDNLIKILDEPDASAKTIREGIRRFTLRAQQLNPFLDNVLSRSSQDYVDVAMRNLQSPGYRLLEGQGIDALSFNNVSTSANARTIAMSNSASEAMDSAARAASNATQAAARAAELDPRRIAQSLRQTVTTARTTTMQNLVDWQAYGAGVAALGTSTKFFNTRFDSAEVSHALAEDTFRIGNMIIDNVAFHQVLGQGGLIREGVWGIGKGAAFGFNTLFGAGAGAGAAGAGGAGAAGAAGGIGAGGALALLALAALGGYAIWSMSARKGAIWEAHVARQEEGLGAMVRSLTNSTIGGISTVFQGYEDAKSRAARFLRVPEARQFVGNRLYDARQNYLDALAGRNGRIAELGANALYHSTERVSNFIEDIQITTADALDKRIRSSDGFAQWGWSFVASNLYSLGLVNPLDDVTNIANSALVDKMRSSAMPDMNAEEVAAATWHAQLQDLQTFSVPNLLSPFHAGHMYMHPLSAQGVQMRQRTSPMGANGRAFGSNFSMTRRVNAVEQGAMRDRAARLEHTYGQIAYYAPAVARTGDNDVRNPLGMGRPPGSSPYSSTTGSSGHMPNISVEYSSGPIEGMSAAEYDLLQRLVLAEAQTEGTVGMAAVTRSIANRVALVQSGTLTPGTYNAVGGSWDNIMRAQGQYQPFSDGRINIAWTEEQLESAREAIALGLNVEEFRDVLVEQLEIDATRAETIVDSTGFRTAYAFNDESQNFNRMVLGNHVFNSDRFASQLDPSAIAETTLKPSQVLNVTSANPQLSVTTQRSLGESIAAGTASDLSRPVTHDTVGNLLDRHVSTRQYNEQFERDGIGLRVISGFGWRNGRPHTGADVVMAVGTPLYNPYEQAEVLAARWYDGYGYGVQIAELDDQGNRTGVTAFFAHLNSMNVNVGDVINGGTVVAGSGNTGRSEGPHLHFEEGVNGVIVAPSYDTLAAAVGYSRRHLEEILSEDDRTQDDNLVNTRDSTDRETATQVRRRVDAELNRTSALEVSDEEAPNLNSRQNRIHPLGRLKNGLSNLFNRNKPIEDDVPAERHHDLTHDAEQLQSSISVTDFNPNAIHARYINAELDGHGLHDSVTSHHSQHLARAVNEDESGTTQRNMMSNGMLAAIAVPVALGFGHQLIANAGRPSPALNISRNFMRNIHSRGYIRLGPTAQLRRAMPQVAGTDLEGKLVQALFDGGTLRPVEAVPASLQNNPAIQELYRHNQQLTRQDLIRTKLTDANTGKLIPFSDPRMEKFRAQPEIQRIYQEEFVRSIVETIDPRVDWSRVEAPQIVSGGADLGDGSYGFYMGDTNSITLRQDFYDSLFTELKPTYAALDLQVHELVHAAIDADFGNRSDVANLPGRDFYIGDAPGQATEADFTATRQYAERAKLTQGLDLSDPRILGSIEDQMNSLRWTRQDIAPDVADWIDELTDRANVFDSDIDKVQNAVWDAVINPNADITRASDNVLKYTEHVFSADDITGGLNEFRELMQGRIAVDPTLKTAHDFAVAQLQSSIITEANAYKLGHNLRGLALESYAEIYGIKPEASPGIQSQIDANLARYSYTDSYLNVETDRAAWIAQRDRDLYGQRAQQQAVQEMTGSSSGARANPTNVIEMQPGRVAASGPTPGAPSRVSRSAPASMVMSLEDAGYILPTQEATVRMRQLSNVDLPGTTIARQTDEMAAAIRATTDNFAGMRRAFRSAAPALEWAGAAADFMPIGMEVYNQRVLQRDLTAEERIRMQYRNNEAMAEAGGEAAVGIMSGALVTTGVGAFATAYGLGAPVTVPATIIGTVAVSAVTSKPAREVAGAVGRTYTVHQTTLDQTAHVRREVFDQMEVAPVGRVSPGQAPVRISQLSREERANRRRANRVTETIVTRARDDMREELSLMTESMSAELASVRRAEMEVDLEHLERSQGRGAHIQANRLRRSLANGDYLRPADREFIEHERRRAEEYWTTFRGDPNEALEATREYARTRTQEFTHQADRYREIAPERASLRVGGARRTPDTWNPAEPTHSRNQVMVQMIRQGVLTREDESIGRADVGPEAAATETASPATSPAPQRVQVVVPPSEQDDLTHELNRGQTDTVTRDIPMEQPNQSLQIVRDTNPGASSSEAEVTTQVQVVTTVNQSQATVIANTDTAQVCSVDEESPGLWGRMTGWFRR